MDDDTVLRPAAAAERLGVRTLVVLTAMHEQRVPRVRLSDGTLGVPASALHLIAADA
jgi:hypothetical protein